MAGGASVNRPAKLTVFNTLAFVFKENGIKGLYRGVTPRIGLGAFSLLVDDEDNPLIRKSHRNLANGLHGQYGRYVTAFSLSLFFFPDLALS